jgi:V/A-type H+/Na+-transporting ATPase subunit D
MEHAIHSPPGRAGRLWLRDRLALASRAVSLLDTKVRLLRRELDRLAAVAEQSAAEWESACRQAQEWQRRVVIGGGGARGLRLNHSTGSADVIVAKASVMGISYPDSISCRLPERSSQMAVVGGGAIVEATPAFERALQRGAECAVAAAARAALATEIDTTSQRLRALRDRWIPALETSLHGIESALDELERTDSARLRWATAPTGAGGQHGQADPRRGH